MKPKEFDELIRQKFDQNDFAYDSRNWESLAQELDGRTKKRNIIMWWVMPLAGVAASVALAMGVINVVQRAGVASPVATETALQHPKNAEQNASAITSADANNTLQNNPVAAKDNGTKLYKQYRSAKINNNPANKSVIGEDGFGIKIANVVVYNSKAIKKDINLLNAPVSAKDKKKEQKFAARDVINTFKEPDVQPAQPARLSVILLGGINHGNLNSGYIAGAAIRKMISDKVYFENDVAFVSSSNTESSLEQVTGSGKSGGTAGKVSPSVFAQTGSATTSQGSSSGLIGQGAAMSTAARAASARPAARGTSTQLAARPTSVNDNGNTQSAPPITYKDENVSFDLYYAQVAPSLGVKIVKNMSVGIGPDFEQMLTDNRPAPSTVDRGNIAVDPMFDVGFIGKTEYSVTRNIKAAVSYRKGINNILTPMDKYIDRDYLQLQLKCAIFNK